MLQIGAEGGLLNSPVALHQLAIAPGERADVLIDFSVHGGHKNRPEKCCAGTLPDGPRLEGAVEFH